jgi:molecular chaperone GrpE (heat shock protein)
MNPVLRLFNLKGFVEDGDSLIEWAADEITTLRQQLANSEARVAELEADNEHQRERRNAARDCIQKMKAESLRKQAEAVAFVLDKLVEDQPKVSANVTGVINYYAQRLRQQADEAERAGGDK